MPLIESNDYRPYFPFRNSHINTIFPSLFRRQPAPEYVRERIITSDDDFLDLDNLHAGSQQLAIVCHGLEGSSNSQYIQGTSRILHKNGWDVTAINHRSCSGEMNHQLRMYHSGATMDLHEVIQYLAPRYEEVVLVGFSLGGNMVLKYLGDGVYDIHQKVKAAATVSVPIDLLGGSIEISKFKNRIYDHSFLKSLNAKAFQKHQQYPDQFKIENLEKVKTLCDFDEYFTAPIHGFADARDYYNQCSSKQFLKNIQTPTLLIQAKDDPFLSLSCYPEKIAVEHENFYLMQPKYGGHVGFSMPGHDHYWEERKVLEFLQKVNDH